VQSLKEAMVKLDSEKQTQYQRILTLEQKLQNGETALDQVRTEFKIEKEAASKASAEQQNQIK
jgi:hypothetical protein